MKPGKSLLNEVRSSYYWDDRRRERRALSWCKASVMWETEAGIVAPMVAARRIRDMLRTELQVRQNIVTKALG